jgi:hypothetical protein
MEAVGGRRHAGGGGVSGAGSHERAVVVVRSDVLGRQVIAEGEGESVCVMRVSEQVTELAHCTSAEGWCIDFRIGADAAEVRNGRMEWRDEVLHGR